MYLWRERLPSPSVSVEGCAASPGVREPAGVDWGFTDRAGGVSTGRYAGLNLAGHVGDEPGHVATNRARVAESLGVPAPLLLFPAQCHGADVALVDRPWDGGGPAAADALVTTRADLALGVLVADCVPVLLADRRAGVAAAAHAGRPGLLAGVVDAVLDAMAAAGGSAPQAAVGPAVCGRCYEVPEALRALAAARSGVAATVSWTGTPAIDVAAGVVERLHARGVPVTWVPGCSREHPDLYSYRRDGRTGRSAGVVRLLR